MEQLPRKPEPRVALGTVAETAEMLKMQGAIFSAPESAAHDAQMSCTGMEPRLCTTTPSSFWRMPESIVIRHSGVTAKRPTWT